MLQIVETNRISFQVNYRFKIENKHLRIKYYF